MNAVPRQHSRWRAVVDTAVDGVILINAQGIVLVFNPACEKLFGYAAFEVIGRNVKMLMPEPYAAQHDRYLSNYHDTGIRKIIGIGREVLGRRRDGATFPMDLSVGETVEDGEPIFVGIVRDLSERKAAEQALREGASRLKAVVDTAVDGVILIDEKGAIRMFNPACEGLFGYSAAEVMGHNVKMLMPEAYQGEHDDHLHKHRTTHELKIIGIGREVAGRRKDGSTFPMNLSVGEAKQENGSVFVGVIHDLTSRKRTEEQLLQAQKMESVGLLSGGIAHDFNNLLTVMLGNAEALSLRLKDRNDLRPLAENIINAAERGAEMTQRLLAFSRRQQLKPAVIDCNTLVTDMQTLLRRTLRQDIELHVALAEGDVTALADRAQLESALLNLALNAQDAMPNGGALTMTTALVMLDPDSLGPSLEVRPGAYVNISVTDDGSGMSQDVLDRVFEPFFTTKEAGKGSGLGLSMVYGFARQSNGHVSIYSELGFGTTVRLCLPSAAGIESTEARSVGDAPTHITRGDETILVVEDDPFVRGHAVASLESLGYRVLVVAQGRQALSILQSGAKIDLLFSDIVMRGGMNGWELAAQAKLLEPQLKVLFTSGYPQEALSRRTDVDTSAPILTKPYRLALLAQRVREVLDG